MKMFVRILLLIFCFSCSNMERTPNIEVPKKAKENEAPISNQSVRKNEPPPAPPLPPKSQTKEEKQTVKEKEQSKVEKELTSMKDVMKRKLEEYNNGEETWLNVKSILSEVNVRSFSEDEFKKIKQQYDLVCEKQELNLSTSYNQIYSENYDNSSTKANKMDGRIFCLHKLMENENVVVKLLYGRNEGGHSTDAVYVLIMNETLLQTQQLDLYVETGWDGYSTTIESTFIDPMTIKRKVTEVIGWREANDRDGKFQPYVETKQIFKLLEDGTVRKESEEIRKHNFERYLD